MKGVEEVLPGYIDGNVKNPSYREVCSGRTGHTEAISISYNSKVISVIDLLLIFFNTHDPTTLNRQGNDIGTQYRSGVYFTETEQNRVALQIIKKLENEKIFDNPILTEVKEATPFYKAEKEHLNYFNENPNQPYCNFLIDPKIIKLKKHFSEYIRESYESEF